MNIEQRLIGLKLQNKSIKRGMNNRILTMKILPIAVISMAFCVAFVFLPSFCIAQSSKKLIQKLPINFAGYYQWRGSNKKQNVKIEFKKIYLSAGNKIEIIGSGTYQGSRLVKINIRAVLDPETLEIELWERDPSDPKFITNGSHRGRLTQNLQKIEAVWTSQSTNKKGDLVLEASNIPW
jgi:hypothetical protein